MIPYLLSVLTLLFALISILILRRGVRAGITEGWPAILLSASIASFIYLYGAWVFLSIYLDYIFAIIYVTLFIFGIARRPSVVQVKRSATKAFFSLLISAVFFMLSVLYFTGTIRNSYRIAHLRLPFKNGRYFVLQGGKGLPANAFHYGLRGAIFAMDIVKLNNAGNRANSVFSTRLDDYAIFQDTIYSPCTGIVKHVATNNPDNIPPIRKRGPTNTNHVLLETNDMYVFMGHFSFGKVFVKEGEKVEAGQPLGLAGNSGFSIEPHLHIQAHENTHRGLP